jgi:hypothetical protein
MITILNKKKMFTEKEIPSDIQEYFQIMAITGGMMGLDMYRRCQEIIDNNPKWFTWEHKYKSIPNEVHEAYKDEIDPDRHLPLFERFKPNGSEEGFNGLLPSIMNNPNIVHLDFSKEALEKFSLVDAMKEMFEQQEDERKRRLEKEKKDKELWDKHYKKYKLEWRSESRW